MSSTDEEKESAPIRKIKRSFRYLCPDYDEDDVCTETRDNYKLFTSSRNSLRKVNYSLHKVDNQSNHDAECLLPDNETTDKVKSLESTW